MTFNDIGGGGLLSSRFRQLNFKFLDLPAQVAVYISGRHVRRHDRA
jgi:hypothetical protein